MLPPFVLMLLSLGTEMHRCCTRICICACPYAAQFQAASSSQADSLTTRQLVSR